VTDPSQPDRQESPAARAVAAHARVAGARSAAARANSAENPDAPDNGPAAEAAPMRADARRNRAAILAAAETVFAESGPSASTEQVAARAGVAIGTVFRHFPTKDALLGALMNDLLARLTADAAALISGGEPANALFTFFALVIDRAAAKKTVAALLSAQGTSVPTGGPVLLLREEIQALLIAGQQAGTVREDVGIAEVTALLAAASDAALRAGWTRTCSAAHWP
jgi:AcrR family transcriptional regulator